MEPSPLRAPSRRTSALPDFVFLSTSLIFSLFYTMAARASSTAKHLLLPSHRGYVHPFFSRWILARAPTPSSPTSLVIPYRKFQQSPCRVHGRSSIRLRQVENPAPSRSLIGQPVIKFVLAKKKKKRPPLRDRLPLWCLSIQSINVVAPH
ncbi:hypothetical protein IWX90DRAFT_305169 [Phyllosticta citrichinensis]|uniref:Uncharacterized protein n=1 Tax=Phyllosticta citrichinensis TaxID=1130410 RepID=A0ABR1XLH8_9PEZI